MGWNFGCVIIAFDFQTVIDKLVEPERRQFMTGAEDPDERRSKELIDVGTGVFDLLGVTCVPDDAPISFSDATSRFFDDYAVGVLAGKTLLAGRHLGLDQESPKLVAAYARLSANYGPVTVGWCNDASDTYMVSVFQNGTRCRFWASGPGLAENEGAFVAGESAVKIHGHDRLMGILEAATNHSFSSLLDLPMERFSAC